MADQIIPKLAGDGNYPQRFKDMGDGTWAELVLIADAYSSPQAVSWTSATALNTANTIPVTGFDGILISVVAPGTITGGMLVFEVYDGAAWLPAQAGKMNGYGGQTSVSLAGGINQGWQINTAGCQKFRTRISGAIAGSGNVVVTHVASSANMPDPVTVGLDPAQPLPAGFNLIGQVQPAYTAPATLASGTAVNLTNYGTVRVQVDSLSNGGSITFAGSVAQGGTTYPLATIINTQTGASASSITANGVYQVLFAGGLWVTPTVSGTATLTMSAGQ